MNKKKRFQVVIMVAAVFLCGIIYICLGPGRTAVFAGDGDGQVYIAGGSGSDGDSPSDSSPDLGEAGREFIAGGSGDDGDSLSDSSPDPGDVGRVFIYICGAVKKPGVYSFESAPRIVEVVEKAGGFTKKADRTSVNLASQADDGAQIVVYERSGDGQSRADPAGAASGTGSADTGSGTIPV